MKMFIQSNKMKIGEKDILISFLIDYHYLSKDHHIEISSQKILDEFINGIADQLPAILEPLAINDPVLKKKLSGEIKIKLVPHHIFYEIGDNFGPVERKHYTPHAIRTLIHSNKERCAVCAEINSLSEERVDPDVLSSMCEVIIEGILGSRQIDVFILIGGNKEYNEVMKLCKCTKTKIIVAAFNDDPINKVPKQNYDGFLDIRKLDEKYVESGNENYETSRPDEPVEVYPACLGISVSVCKEEVKSILEELEIAPKLINEKEHRFEPERFRFFLVYYSSIENAEKAKNIVFEFIMIDSGSRRLGNRLGKA